jgi:hypothetical protein
MINSESIIYILLEKFEDSKITNNSILIINIKNSIENILILEDDIKRITNMKFINIEYTKANEEENVRYLALVGENQSKQGIMYIYKCSDSVLMIEGKYQFVKPVSDLCQSGDILLLSIDNTLCSMNIIVADGKFTLQGRSQQKHLNKVKLFKLDCIAL